MVAKCCWHSQEEEEEVVVVAAGSRLGIVKLDERVMFWHFGHSHGLDVIKLESISKIYLGCDENVCCLYVSNFLSF